MPSHSPPINKQIKNAQEHSCNQCSKRFISRGPDQSPHCPICQKTAHEQQEREKEQRENEEWQRKKAEEREEFDIQLKNWEVIGIEEIHPQQNHVLYIIGNGFDLMHGVKSSYYAFRDSLGKHSALRYALENFLMAENIWSDFENALASFNMAAMGGRHIVGNWLDIFDVGSDNSSDSAFFLASEAAANPILTVVNELPRRFRRWVETLSIGTEDRPLQNMFSNGKVICFNYTEFVETLYGVSESNICYIHGCRRKRKNQPKEKLILGHMPDADDSAYEFEDDFLTGAKDSWKLAMLEAAQEQTFRLIGESDEALTKNCDEIISAHEPFFSELNEIREIIVIGHSLAPVDWAYFYKVASCISKVQEIHWYFGCHGLGDLKNLEHLLENLEIPRSAISVFRTDNIVVTCFENKQYAVPMEKQGGKKIKCTSPDGQWFVKTGESLLTIVNQENNKIDYEAAFPWTVSDAFFILSGKYLLVIIRGVESGILLFHIEDNHWKFVNEFEGISHQSLINPRLKKVCVTEQRISFVYNNRVREYLLADGTLNVNKSLHNARNFMYSGEDISHLFLKRK